MDRGTGLLGLEPCSRPASISSRIRKGMVTAHGTVYTGHMIVPWERARAEAIDARIPIYVPSIPSMLDAPHDHRRAAVGSNRRNYLAAASHRPAVHVYNLIRYLHLERPHQQERILETLARRYRPAMQDRLKKYRRTQFIEFNNPNWRLLK